MKPINDTPVNSFRISKNCGLYTLFRYVRPNFSLSLPSILVMVVKVLVQSRLLVAPLTIHIMVYNNSVIHSYGYSHMHGAITIQLRQLYTISIFVIPVGICSNNVIAQMFIVLT